MADWRQNYNGTGAPMVVGNLVVSGIAGGDEGVRGFVAAYDQATGKEVWRFWAVPKRGEPGAETWKGSAIDHPGAATWMTGNYDAELGTLYWAVGNPGPDMIDCDDSGALSAADARTGKVLWSFQTSQVWKSSPMTYTFDDRQYVGVAAGPSILAFGLSTR